MAQLLRERADARPDELAVRLREGGAWIEWTWSEYWQKAASAAAVLRESGVEPGDHVLVLVPEMRQAVTCLFGLWVLGAVPVHLGAPPVQDRAAFLEGLIETARRLEALPATAAAVRSGEISGAQASEIAASASVDPDAETALLETAQAGASFRAVRDQCRETTMRAADDAAEHDDRGATQVGRLRRQQQQRG